MDVGTNEGEGKEPEDYVREAKHINEVLQKKEGISVKFIIDEGGQHNEKYWAKRFPEAFLWTFAENSNNAAQDGKAENKGSVIQLM